MGFCWPWPARLQELQTLCWQCDGVQKRLSRFGKGGCHELILFIPVTALTCQAKSSHPLFVRCPPQLWSKFDSVCLQSWWSCREVSLCMICPSKGSFKKKKFHEKKRWRRIRKATKFFLGISFLPSDYNNVPWSGSVRKSCKSQCEKTSLVFSSCLERRPSTRRPSKKKEKKKRRKWIFV